MELSLVLRDLLRSSGVDSYVPGGYTKGVLWRDDLVLDDCLDSHIAREPDGRKSNSGGSFVRVVKIASLPITEVEYRLMQKLRRDVVVEADFLQELESVRRESR